MKVTRKGKFVCNGKEFEVNFLEKGDQFSMHMTLEGERVSPECSVSIENYLERFIQYEDDLVRHLIDIFKSDIENGVYFNS